MDADVPAAEQPAPDQPAPGPAVADEPVPDLTIGDAHFAEQFPLSPLDDYMIHQTPDPIRVMWSSDPRAYERYWMVCHDPARRGAGRHRAAASTRTSTGPRRTPSSTTTAATRPCGASAGWAPTGPICASGPSRRRIVRGMRWWRYVLEPNEWGISYELDVRDTTRQMFREPLSNTAAGTPPGAAQRRDHRLRELRGGRGLGRGPRHPHRDPRRLAGTRDRHWGIGRGVGGPALALGGRLHVGVSGNAFVAFPSWTLWGDRVFYLYGDARPGMGRVAKPSRRLRFEPDTEDLRRGRRRLHARQR